MKDNIYWRHEETVDDGIRNNNDKDEIVFEEQVVEDDKSDEEQVERRSKGFEDLEVCI
jgi:hypothetical protein